MKASFLVALAAVSFAACCSAQIISMDDAVRAGIQNFQEMLNETSSYGQGCCPKIVRPGPTGSVIAGFSGYRGNAAIIVDWGTCPAQPAGGFYWYVYWGDGTYSYQTTTTLGPFQAVHQYPLYQNVYNVYVYYCSNPPYPSARCCDSLSGYIFAYKEDV